MTSLIRAVRISFLLSSVATVLLTFASPSRAEEDEERNIVKWGNIIGLVSPGFFVGGIIGFGFPWTAEHGKAKVNLESGDIRFTVKGLVLANSTPIAVAGTIGVTQQVKGTLVCNGLGSPVASTFVDTPAVPFHPQGDARFEGQVNIPGDCLVTPNRLAFLIRVADAPANPIIVNRWIAVGVLRTP